MLSYATVEPRTLEILRAIMSVAIFSQTRLVGGTSLALQLGHRKSIDLDFFGCIKSENEEIKDVLRDIGQLSVIKESRHIKIYMVDPELVLEKIVVNPDNSHYSYMGKPSKCF